MSRLFFVVGVGKLRLRFDHNQPLHSGVDVADVFIHTGVVKFQAEGLAGAPSLCSNLPHLWWDADARILFFMVWKRLFISQLKTCPFFAQSCWELNWIDQRLYHQRPITSPVSM